MGDHVCLYTNYPHSLCTHLKVSLLYPLITSLYIRYTQSWAHRRFPDTNFPISLPIRRYSDTSIKTSILSPSLDYIADIATPIIVAAIIGDSYIGDVWKPIVSNFESIAATLESILKNSAISRYPDIDSIDMKYRRYCDNGVIGYRRYFIDKYRRYFICIYRR